MKNFPLPFKILQRDYDSEFSSWFSERVKVLGLAHRYSRARKPSDNGYVERFIRALQEECLSRIVQIFGVYQREIPEYLNYSNNERLHNSLGFKTPMEVIKCFQVID